MIEAKDARRTRAERALIVILRMGTKWYVFLVLKQVVTTEGISMPTGPATLEERIVEVKKE